MTLPFFFTHPIDYRGKVAVVAPVILWSNAFALLQARKRVQEYHSGTPGRVLLPRMKSVADVLRYRARNRRRPGSPRNVEGAVIGAGVSRALGAVPCFRRFSPTSTAEVPLCRDFGGYRCHQ